MKGTKGLFVVLTMIMFNGVNADNDPSSAYYFCDKTKEPEISCADQLKSTWIRDSIELYHIRKDKKELVQEREHLSAVVKSITDLGKLADKLVILNRNEAQAATIKNLEDQIKKLKDQLPPTPGKSKCKDLEDGNDPECIGSGASSNDEAKKIIQILQDKDLITVKHWIGIEYPKQQIVKKYSKYQVSFILQTESPNKDSYDEIATARLWSDQRVFYISGLNLKPKIEGGKAVFDLQNIGSHEKPITFGIVGYGKVGELNNLAFSAEIDWEEMGQYYWGLVAEIAESFYGKILGVLGFIAVCITIWGYRNGLIKSEQFKKIALFMSKLFSFDKMHFGSKKVKKLALPSSNFKEGNPRFRRKLVSRYN